MRVKELQNTLPILIVTGVGSFIILKLRLLMLNTQL